MRRRDFCRMTLAGSVAGGGLAALSSTAGGAEKPRPPAPKARIDPDALAEAAHKHFIPGKRTCGEAILMAGCEALGITSDLVPDIALGLAGGVGLQGRMCGTMTGSAMVIGLAVGRSIKEYKPKQMKTLGQVGKVVRAFEKQFGSTDCRKICGLDLTTPEGRKMLVERVKAAKCDKCVRVAARLLAERLNTIRGDRFAGSVNVREQARRRASSPGPRPGRAWDT